MKYLLLTIVSLFLVYSAFKRIDAVESIDFRGESYTLTEDYTRSGADVYMYAPGGQNFMRAGKYIQVAHLPAVEMSAEEYRNQYMQTLRQAPGFQKISEESFFYVEANTLVHSALIQEGDRFKLYGFAEILPEGASSNPGDHSPNQSIAREFEETIRKLPRPPRGITTWF